MKSIVFTQAYLAFYVIDELGMANSAKALVGVNNFSLYILDLKDELMLMS